MLEEIYSITTLRTKREVMVVFLLISCDNEYLTKYEEYTGF